MQVSNCNLSSPPLSLSELNDSVNENSDTVGQIVQYIMKNEGMAVLVSRTIHYSHFIKNLLQKHVLLKTRILLSMFLKLLVTPST